MWKTYRFLLYPTLSSVSPSSALSQHRVSSVGPCSRTIMSQVLQGLTEISLHVMFSFDNLQNFCSHLFTSLGVKRVFLKLLIPSQNCLFPLDMDTSDPWDPLKGKWSWRWNGQLQLRLILLFIKRWALTAVPIGCASLPSSHHEDLYFQIITRPETVKVWWSWDHKALNNTPDSCNLLFLWHFPIKQCCLWLVFSCYSLIPLPRKLMALTSMESERWYSKIRPNSK